MTYEISSGRSFVSLALDEMAYRLLRRLHKRTHAQKRSAPPLFAPTTDLITHRLIATGMFERTQIEAVDALLDERRDLIEKLSGSLDVFIDVGANIGIYTTRYASQFKQVLAIEANPITFDVLRSNIALSQATNVSAACVGASDSDGHLQLRFPRSGVMGGASFDETRECNDCVVEVPVRPLDKIAQDLAPHTPVTLMKIDVEGHEASVLRGARSILRQHKPVVLYEQLSRPAGVECAALLRDAGYEKFLAF